MRSAEGRGQREERGGRREDRGGKGFGAQGTANLVRYNGWKRNFVSGSVWAWLVGTCY